MLFSRLSSFFDLRGVQIIPLLTIENPLTATESLSTAYYKI